MKFQVSKIVLNLSHFPGMNADVQNGKGDVTYVELSLRSDGYVRGLHRTVYRLLPKYDPLACRYRNAFSGLSLHVQSGFPVLRESLLSGLLK